MKQSEGLGNNIMLNVLRVEEKGTAYVEMITSTGYYFIE